jgi:glucose/arabinose dehydrogenase
MCGSTPLTRKASLLILSIAAVSAVVGCSGMQVPFHRKLDDTPAPTPVPLPSPTPLTPAPTVVDQAPTRPATATPEASATVVQEPSTGPVAPPTRVVSPTEPIRLPAGFGITVFAQGLQDPRMMALGPDGDLYVAERGTGRVLRLPDHDEDGVADRVEVVAEGLRAPSSIDFHADGSLYVGETTRVVRLGDAGGDGFFEELQVFIDGLPSGGHNTRTVLVAADGSGLLVSIGSSCNVCVEGDERRATIMRYDEDGGTGSVFARGLRNAVGIAFRPGTDELWATNNGRDWLGDDLPPETVYHVPEGEDAGWPRCHAGRIVDPDLGEPGDCDGVAVPEVEIQAHSAPLGLTFYTGQQFPETYQGDMFVALHGSWNRSAPVGYAVAHIPMQDGQPGPVRDFAVGWLREDGSNWGRPVDVLTGPDGSLFVSEDSRGTVYRIYYAGGQE